MAITPDVNRLMQQLLNITSDGRIRRDERPALARLKETAARLPQSDATSAKAQALLGFTDHFTNARESVTLREFSKAVRGEPKSLTLTPDRIEKVIGVAKDAHQTALAEGNYAAARKIEDDLWQLTGSGVEEAFGPRGSRHAEFLVASEKLTGHRAQADGTAAQARVVAGALSVTHAAELTAKFQWNEADGQPFGNPRIAITPRTQLTERQRIAFETRMTRELLSLSQEPGHSITPIKLGWSDSDQTLVFEFERPDHE